MSEPSTPLADRLAKIARIVLLAAIAVVLALIVLGPKSGGMPNPLSVPRVQAEGGICAAPGYIIMPIKVGGASQFYVCDTNKQVICVYETTGEKIRLISVRKFDNDVGIFVASIPIGNVKAPEGHTPGLNRKEAGDYAEAIKKWREKFESKKRP